TLIRDQVVQVGEPCEKRLLTAPGMMEALHRKELPLEGVMRLIQQGAGYGHLWGCEDHIPAGFLLVKPAPRPLALSCSSRGAGGVVKVAEPLPERHRAQALPLSLPVAQGVELRQE